MSEIVLNRIQNAYSSLSKQGKSLADFFQADPQSAAQLSITEIAKHTGVSKATVSRFFRQIGFESHQDLRQQLLQLRNKGYPVSHSSDLHQLVAQETELVSSALQQLDLAKIEQCVDKLHKAAHIRIIGLRNSYPVALHLREQLIQIRPRVDVLPLPGQTLSEELAQLEPNDLVIVIGLRRRPRIIEKLLKQLPFEQVMLIADPSGLNLSVNAAISLVVPLGEQTSFDSYGAMFSVISLLCNRLIQQSGVNAEQRVASIAKHFLKLNELE